MLLKKKYPDVNHIKRWSSVLSENFGHHTYKYTVQDSDVYDLALLPKYSNRTTLMHLQEKDLFDLSNTLGIILLPDTSVKDMKFEKFWHIKLNYTLGLFTNKP